MPVNVDKQKKPASRIPLFSALCAKLSRILSPTMGGRHRIAITGPLSFHLIDTYALIDTVEAWKSPTGTLNSIVSKGSFTNDLIMSGPKVPIPLDGTEAQKFMTTQSQVLGSRRASKK